jgi:epsilon-lactone hydrolase
VVAAPERIRAQRKGILVASEELQTVLKLVRGMDLDGMTVAERRAVGAAVAPQPPPGTLVEPADADGVPAEWVVAAGVNSGRVVVYFHGGAYQMGSPATLRHMIAVISAAAQARVLSVDYRLAPEHPFPAAVEDAVTAYRWLLASGVDPASVAFAGDSAGGGLALAALVAVRDCGHPLPRAAVGLSPWTDLALTGESLRTRAKADVMLQPSGMPETAALYLAGQDPRHPHASPLYARWDGLPPILLQVGDAEVLLDDSTRLAAKARAAGVDVTLEVWDEMPHVWHAWAGLLPEADQAIGRVGHWLAEHWPEG